MGKKKSYDVVSEYNRQVKRILNFWKRAEARGYTFNKTGVIRDIKNPTKTSVERLKKFTPQALYNRSTFTIPNTTIQIKGTEGRKYERSQASKRGWETRRSFHEKRAQQIGEDNIPNEGEVVMRNVTDEISEFTGDSEWEQRKRIWAAEMDGEILYEEITSQAEEIEGMIRLGYNAWFNTKMQTNASVVLRLISIGISKHGYKGFLRLLARNADEIRAILNSIYDSKQQTGTTAENHLANLAVIFNNGALDDDLAEEIENYQDEMWFEAMANWND